MFVKNRQRDGAGACRGFGDMGLVDGDSGDGVGGYVHSGEWEEDTSDERGDDRSTEPEARRAVGAFDELGV